MYSIVIGVDIAKLKFDVASLNNGKYKHKVFTNNEQGYHQFINWLLLLAADDKPLICMEATGAYIEFVHNVKKRGKRLLSSLLETLLKKTLESI